MNEQEARNKCVTAGQEQVLRYLDELDEAGKQRIFNQIEDTDFGVIKAGKSAGGARGNITPIDAMEREEIIAREVELRKAGVKMLQEGKVAAVLLAGGMGTRLGANGPKGDYNMGLSKDLPIFKCLINNALDVVKETGVFFHFFIMTSEKNHEQTIASFKAHNFWGYDELYIHFFKQEMAPATDFDGKVYLEEKDRLATSPNGNGGWYRSMIRVGLDQMLEEYGIEWLNVFAVDNVLQRICDPLFIGATVADGFTSGGKVIRKKAPEEKVGTMCLEDGKPSIVEYYELTDELAQAKNDKGEPAYNFGVILNYLFKVDVIKNITSDLLPLHVVDKKIPYLDSEGHKVNPTEPNGHKYETLILDMIHLCPDALVFEVVRENEFAPVKNKTGVDSAESAQALMQYNGIEL